MKKFTLKGYETLISDSTQHDLCLSTKSDRSIEDGSAPMDMDATNTLERMAASVGQLNAVEPSFVASMDVAILHFQIG